MPRRHPCIPPRAWTAPPPRRTLLAALLSLAALLAALTGAAPAAHAATSTGRALLVGQSNTGAWSDLVSSTGASPQGGSVYYSVRDGGFSGACGTTCEQDYAASLASQGREIEVGVSWMDDPPGWDGTEDTGARTCSGYYDDYVSGNLNAVPHAYPVDMNILRMMWWAQQHNKPMTVAESGVQRMSDNLDADGTQSDADFTTWMQRLQTLVTYKGPLPNGVVNGAQTDFVGTGYDLSNVIKAVTYINVDWRYGFDGQTGPSSPIALPSSSGWYVNSLISRYPQGRAAFCSMLSSAAFTTRCS
jgi:hypothetical protein